MRRWSAPPTSRKACAADRARHAAYRPSGDPQSRHHRRLDRLCRSGGRIAGVPAGARRRGRHRGADAASAPSRPTISSRACSRRRSARTTCSPPSAFRLPTRTRASASPSWRAGTATTRWSGWPPRERSNGKGLADVRLAYFGVGDNADARAARPRRRWPAAIDRRRRVERARSRSARRHPGDRRGEEASRRRAAAPRGEATDGAARMSNRTSTSRSPSTASASPRRVEPRKTLVDFLRDDLGLTGSHVGCEHGVCGACTVRVDGDDRARLPDAGGAVRRRQGRNHRGRVGLRRNRRPAGGVRAAQRAAMRLLHARRCC